MADTKTHKRFRLRRLTSFSLRTALICVTVLTVCLGLHMNSVRKQRASVEAVLRHGGGVCYDYQQQDLSASGKLPTEDESTLPAWLRKTLGRDHFHEVVWVITKDHDDHLKGSTDTEIRSQDDVGASDDLLKQMDGFSKLETLTLYGTHANVNGLEFAGRQENLRTMHITGPVELTGEGVAHLAILKELEYLYVAGAQIDEGFLRGLGRLEDLRRLDIADSDFSGDDLKHLKELTQLRELWFVRNGNSIKDHDLAHLEELPRLERLAFFGTSITDEGFRNIAKLDHLRSLTLSGVTVAESELQHIAELKNLRFLHLGNSPITDEGVRRVAEYRKLEGLSLKVYDRKTARWLQQQLPNCNISFLIAGGTVRQPPPKPVLMELHPLFIKRD